jgi:hypothetical protein
MEPTLNRAMFEVTSFDSATPAGAAAVVHRFKAPGQYVVQLHNGGRVVDHRVLSVQGAGGAEAEAAAHGPASLSALPASSALRSPDGVLVDVGDAQPRPGRPAPPRRPGRISMTEGDYASFTAAPGRGARAVVRRAGGAEGEEKVEFDTETLGAEDVFAVTLVRPGTYSLRDTIQKSEGRIVVTYPVIGDTPYRPADPVEIRAAGAGFSPDSVTLGPGQGLIVRIENASRITVDLVKPDEGPHGRSGPTPKGHWRQPRRPG